MKITQVRKRRILRVLVYAITGSILGLMAGYISTLLDNSDHKESVTISILGFLTGLLLGSIFGFFEEFIWHRLSKRISHVPFIIIQLTTYVAMIIIWLVIALSIENVLSEGMAFGEAVLLYIREEDFIRDIIFSAAMAILLIVFGRIRMLHYTRELISLFTGKYYYPEEEIRTIMFVDLVGSTTIAEDLGPLRFSSFLQDCFSNLSEAIFAWRGNVYQYLGDGFILSWRGKYEKSGLYPIKCFFDMQKSIIKNQDYFLSKYGIVPAFRAGIHKGNVITTWVGDRKKELAFHGDTINTAARIQSLCKDYNAQLLISKDAFDENRIPNDVSSNIIGDVIPKGKSKSITLYAITQK